MHQISLLGGLGGLGHTLRPDRVYATGVISPMTGFRPGEAVMSTATRFTQGPYTGMSLSGLRGPGLVARVQAWWQGVKARASGMMPAPQAAAPAVAAQATVQVSPSFAQHQIAPMAAYGAFGPAGSLPHAMTARAYGQSPSLPTYAADAATKTTMMMWRGLRWPWG